MTLRTTCLTAAAMLAGLAASGCATEAAPDRAGARAAEADAVLADYRPTGATRSCLSLRSIDDIEPLDETRWLITLNNGDAYLNEVSRGCRQATSDFTYLQYETPTGSLCANEIVRVIDRSGGGISAGACGLGRHQELERIADSD
ncbi:MAG: DUF6491 family protein [Alphaproteobacteria bacterium]|nr:DUF6491 family protein [Alphaproteobacteria bacterium]